MNLSSIQDAVVGLVLRVLVALALGVFAAGAAHAQTASTVPATVVENPLHDLLRGTTIVARDLPFAACIAAANSDILTRRATANYNCRSSTLFQGVYTPPAPTCTTPAPASSQVLQCPMGQTGSWTQTRTVTAAPYPTCWTTTPYAPSSAPAGACTTPPAGTWTRIAAEFGSFTLAAPATVRYGAAPTWVQRSLPTGAHVCGHFGSGAFAGIADPAPGVAKTCESQSAVVVDPPPPPPTGSLPTYNIASVPAAGSLANVYSERRIANTGEQPAPDAGRIGAARAICGASHFSNDDPLVFPGRVGATHLHVFFGNTGTDANSTSLSLLTSGNGTCRGGIINRSAYWVPAMIDTRAGNVVVPERGNDSQFVYYKTGYWGVRDADVRPVPPAFKMIAGDSKSRVPQPRTASFTCLGVSDSQDTIPANCPAGATLRMSVHFPQCWDGVNVSSPDHRSHVAYAIEGRGCADPRFPVPLPEISMEINYPVLTGGTAGWRLSSDISGTPAGSSGHGDFMMGWETPVMEQFVREVINKGFSASGGIGLGQTLY